MRDYPPGPTIHDARCIYAPASAIAFPAARVMQLHPNGWPHHACFSDATVRMNRPVVAESKAFPEHPYQPSTDQPADASRELCLICRGTHNALSVEARP